ncbi:MAG: hypothetical protein DRP11_02105 [Candidatus Aenigmatarchaeota archaeon]|nr:MAG: hypothetical protein DRP11_02105 [Candidatus Aenigmarchaeota archaeon]
MGFKSKTFKKFKYLDYEDFLMKEDMRFIQTDTGLKISFSDEFIQKFVEALSKKIAEDIYYDILLLKHIPELEAIKKNKLKALEGEEAEKWLENLCGK